MIGRRQRLRWITLEVSLFVVVGLIAAPFAAIADAESPSSGVSFSVLAEIPLPAGTVQASPQYDPLNGNLYVSEALGLAQDGIVLVVSGSNNSVVSVVGADYEPGPPVVDPVNGEVYVSNFMTDSPLPGNVTVISGTSNSANGAISVNTTSSASPMVDPANGNLYIPSTDALHHGAISVVQAASDSVVATISVGGLPLGGGVYAPASGELYVGSNGSELSVVSTVNNTLAAIVPLQSSPGSILYDLWNGDIYVGTVGNYSKAPGLELIVPPSNVAHSLYGLDPPLFLDTAGDVFAESSVNDTALYEIAPSTNQIKNQVNIPYLDPSRLSYDPVGDFLLQGSTNGSLRIVSIGSGRIADTLNFGTANPISFPPTYDPGNGDFYIVGGYSQSLRLLVIGPGSIPSTSSPTLLDFFGDVGAGVAIGVGATSAIVLWFRHRGRVRPPT